MPKNEPVSSSDLFALTLVLEAERAGVAVDQIAEPGCCSDELIELAESMREVLAEIRQKLRDGAGEVGMSPDELDAAFVDILTRMYGARGSMH